MTPITTHSAPSISAAPLFTARGVIAWLIAKDQAYRNSNSLRNMPSHILQDVALEETASGLRRAR